MPNNAQAEPDFKCLVQIGPDVQGKPRGLVDWRTTRETGKPPGILACLVEPRTQCRRSNQVTATVRNTFLAVYRNCAGLEPDERLVHAVAAANRAVNRRVLSGTEGDRDANAVWLTAVAITENAIDYVGIGQGLIAIIETEESHVLRSGGSGERRAAQPALVGTAIRPTNLNVGRTMPSIDRHHFLVLGASGYNHLSPKELNEASRRTRKTPRSAMKDILDFLEETTENPDGGGTLAIIGHA